MSTDKHSATHSFLGYYYQCLFALVALLQADDNDKISIETIDDVTLEGIVTKLHQLKHSMDPKGKLTIKNDGLWKTLRIWSTIAKDELDGESTRFIFVTCQQVDPGHCLASLTVTPEAREKAKVAEVVDALEEEALRVIEERKKVKKENQGKKDKKDLPYATRAPGCEGFLALKKAQRQKLVERIVLFPDAFTIADVPATVENELTTVPVKTRSSVAKRLIEWWDGRMAFAMLQEAGSAHRRITKNELLTMLNEFVYQLRDGSLPHTFMDQYPPVALSYDNNLVKQIDLVDGGQSRRDRAILARWRAMSQRDEWMGEDLMNAYELTKFDEHLVEAWGDEWKPLRDDHTGTTDTAALALAGRGVLDWVHKDAFMRIVPRHEEFRKPYLISGSLQNLADDFRVGWHPHYPTHFKCPSP